MLRGLLLITFTACAFGYPQKLHITPHPKLASLNANSNQKLASVSVTPSFPLVSASETPSAPVARVNANPNYKPNDFELEQNRAASFLKLALPQRRPGSPSLWAHQYTTLWWQVMSLNDLNEATTVWYIDEPIMRAKPVYISLGHKTFLVVNYFLQTFSDVQTQCVSYNSRPGGALARGVVVSGRIGGCRLVCVDGEWNECSLCRHKQICRYQFSTDIEDNINDLSHRRDETREGLSVKGSYSYSDGYYERTVYYEADEKGYRVTKTEVTPLQDGPQIDLTGTASVSSVAHGKHTAYRVQSVPVPGPVPKVITEI